MLELILSSLVMPLVAVAVSILAVFGLGRWIEASRQRDRLKDIPDVPQLANGSGDADGLVILDVFLRGFRIEVPRPELRQHLRIDAAGTDIDSIEDAANHFGLLTHQMIIPAASVLDPAHGKFPCIAVIQETKHVLEFYVLWRRQGDRIQIFETRYRVRWMDADQLQSLFYIHEMQFEGQLRRGAVVLVCYGRRDSRRALRAANAAQ